MRKFLLGLVLTGILGVCFAWEVQKTVRVTNTSGVWAITNLESIAHIRPTAYMSTYVTNSGASSRIKFFVISGAVSNLLVEQAISTVTNLYLNLSSFEGISIPPNGIFRIEGPAITNYSALTFEYSNLGL